MKSSELLTYRLFDQVNFKKKMPLILRFWIPSHVDYAYKFEFIRRIDIWV